MPKIIKPKIIKPKVKSALKKKPVIKKPAIAKELNKKIITHSNLIRKQKIEISKYKINKRLLDGRFYELNNIHLRLLRMEHQAIEAREYLSEIKAENKSNETLSKHDAVLKEFINTTKAKRNHLTNAVGNKLHSLYTRIIEAEKINLKNLSKKEQAKLLDNLATSFNSYQNITSAFSSAKFSGPTGTDLRVDKMIKVIGNINLKVHK